MATWTPDPTFYPSPRMAMQAPPEKLAYVAILHAEGREPDAIGGVEVGIIGAFEAVVVDNGSFSLITTAS